MDVVGEPPPAGEDELTGGEVTGEEGRFVGRTRVGLVEARTDVTGCTAKVERGVELGLGLGLGLGLAEGVTGGLLRCCVVLLPRFDVGGLELWLVPRYTPIAAARTHTAAVQAPATIRRRFFRRGSP